MTSLGIIMFSRSRVKTLLPAKEPLADLGHRKTRCQAGLLGSGEARRLLFGVGGRSLFTSVLASSACVWNVLLYRKSSHVLADGAGCVSEGSFFKTWRQVPILHLDASTVVVVQLLAEGFKTLLLYALCCCYTVCQLI